MAAPPSNHRTRYQPVLSTTLAADYLDFENDQANILAGRRTQQAITSRQRWQSYLSLSHRKRAHLHLENDLPRANEKTDPHLDVAFMRHRVSLPVRIVHRLATRIDNEPHDPDTIPVQTKRQQRKIEKAQRRAYEKIKHGQYEEAEGSQNKQLKNHYNQVPCQLHVHERFRQAPLPTSIVRQSVRDKLKATIKKTAKIRRSKTQVLQDSAQLPDAPTYVPHVDDLEEKSYLRPPFDPADFQTPPAPPRTICEPPPAAELPADSISPPYVFESDAAKRYSDDCIDLDTLPPPIRSPSPCLSSIPRRGVTLSQTPQSQSNKQMQCDYCHDAIKLAGYHYACIVCEDDDRLYCAKCANDGRTCRHELIERTRNIQRHPTNPQPSTHYQERKHCSPDKESVVSVDAHAELSASSPSAQRPTAGTTGDQSSQPTTPVVVAIPANASNTSSDSRTEVFKEFEAKRREQDVIFREKEVTLREREASLREREAWTASRERDAAFVQQLHAAAMLQRERAAEVGAQFMPTPSRHSSYSSHISYLQDDRSGAGSNRATASRSTKITEGPRTWTSHLCNKDSDGAEPEILHISPSRSCSVPWASPMIRHHAGTSKRKSCNNESKPSGKASTRRGHNPSGRPPPQKKNRSLDGDDEESQDSEEVSPKRQKQALDESKRLFACPYFKFEPLRYAEGNTHELHYRGCAGGLYRDISRVKQHLKRVHHRPDFYCRRCFTIFTSNEELQEHSSRVEGCAVEACPFPEKLDEVQQNKIHVKRPGKDPEELWYDIFRIIFPGAPVPHSPYIEATQPKSSEQGILEHFIQLFEAKLDTSVSSQPWLSSVPARDFLRAQMRQTVRDTIMQMSNQPSRVPSVLVSPVSPTNDYRCPTNRQGSSSSRGSSSVRSEDVVRPKDPPLLSPISPITSLRPALKVRTQTSPACSLNDFSRPHINHCCTEGSTADGPMPSSSNSESPLYSARSQSSARFPRLPSHVRDDLEREQEVAGNSWQTGDDVHAMTGAAQEPTSATSTRSGKSVTFATPPPFVASWRDTHEPAATWNGMFQHSVMAPDLSYFTNFDWSADNFTATNVYGQQRLPGKQRFQPPDSAYGTLSSRPSHSSMFPAQSAELERSHAANCVDPQVLFVNPLDANLHMPGVNPDLQAYLNRNGEFGLG